MSLIESAIAKAREVAHGSAARANQTAQNSIQRKRIPAERRVGSADSPESVRQYPVCATNVVRMEENRILPQISDQAALRAYKIMRTRLYFSSTWICNAR